MSLTMLKTQYLEAKNINPLLNILIYLTFRFNSLVINTTHASFGRKKKTKQINHTFRNTYSDQEKVLLNNPLNVSCVLFSEIQKNSMYLEILFLLVVLGVYEQILPCTSHLHSL